MGAQLYQTGKGSYNLNGFQRAYKTETGLDKRRGILSEAVSKSLDCREANTKYIQSKGCSGWGK